jgi:hypothetical protein
MFQALSSALHIWSTRSSTGQISAQQLADADDYLTGNFFGPPSGGAESRKDQLPMAWSIVNFPG